MRSSLCIFLAVALVIVLTPTQAFSAQTGRSTSYKSTLEMVDDIAAYAGFARSRSLTHEERDELLAVLRSTYAEDGDFIQNMRRDMHDSLERLAIRGTDDYGKALIREEFMNYFWAYPPPIVPDVWFTIRKMVNAYNPFLASEPRGVILTHQDAQGYFDLQNWTAKSLGRELPVPPHERAEAEKKLATVFHEGKSDLLGQMGKGEALWSAFQLALRVPALRQQIDERIGHVGDSGTLDDALRSMSDVAESYLKMRSNEENETVLASVGPYRLTEAMFQDFVRYYQYGLNRYFSRTDMARLRELEIADFKRAPEENARNYTTMHKLCQQWLTAYQVAGFYAMRLGDETLAGQFVSSVPEGPWNKEEKEIIARYIPVAARSKDAVVTEDQILAFLSAKVRVRLTLGLRPGDAASREVERNRIVASFPSMSPNERDRLIHADSRLVALENYLTQPDNVAKLKQVAQARPKDAENLAALASEITDTAVRWQQGAAQSDVLMRMRLQWQLDELIRIGVGTTRTTRH